MILEGENTVKRLIAILIALILCANLLSIQAFAYSNDYTENGNMYLNTNVLRDPVCITSDIGKQYAPSSYVYFGDVYNSVLGEYEPILCRVLDSDADNNGELGAIFLLTEEAIVLNQKFSGIDESETYFIDYENIYTTSAINNSFDLSTLFSPEEIEQIRKITKTDIVANMEGMFNFNYDDIYMWETEELDGENIVNGDSATLLKDSYIFPLSAEELSKYVSNYNGSTTLLANNYITGEPTIWWLRTGVNDYQGNLVGSVSPSGTVGAISSESSQIAFRPALNVETTNISYFQEIENNTYRIAFHTDKANNFAAEFVSVNDSVVTISYRNAPLDTTPDNKKTGSISIIVKNELDEVIYYETLAEATSQSGELSFTLPEDVQFEEDYLTVFWEEKADNNKSVSFAGKFINLGIIHEYNNEVCSECGEYQIPYLNDNNTNSTEDDYYEIGTPNQLHWFSTLVNNGAYNANATLIKDIDLKNSTWTPIGKSDNPFNGVFDGNGHTVSRFFINSSVGAYIGFVGNLSGTVKNLGIEKNHFSGEPFVGGIVGLNSGTVINCYNTGEVNGGDHIGGIVGHNANTGRIENCYSIGKVNGAPGGVVGYNDANGVVASCYYLGTDSTIGEGTLATAEQFASGEVAYLLGSAFGQNLSDNGDAYPTFANEENKVYSGYLSCADDAQLTYTNDSSIPSEKPKHELGEDEYCANNCGDRAFRIVNGKSYFYGGAFIEENLELNKNNNYNGENWYFDAGEGFIIFEGSRYTELHNATITNALAYPFREVELHVFGKCRIDGLLELNNIGGGTLTITLHDSATLDIYGKDESPALYIADHLVINGDGVLNVYGGAYTDVSEVFHVLIYSADTITVNENATLNVYPGKCIIGTMQIAIATDDLNNLTGNINAIVLTGIEGEGAMLYDITVIGNVVLSEDFTFSQNLFDDEAKDLLDLFFTIPKGASLKVSEGVTLDISGYDKLTVEGKLIADKDATVVCEHIGGTATCTDPKKCEKCTLNYGEPLGHSHGTSWVTDATSHWKECVCGDKSSVAPHADEDNDGKCDACEYEMLTNDPSAPTPDLPEPSTPITNIPQTEENDESNDTETEAPKNNGCGSSIALSAITIVAIVGSALVIKKEY